MRPKKIHVPISRCSTKLPRREVPQESKLMLTVLAIVFLPLTLWLLRKERGL